MYVGAHVGVAQGYANAVDYAISVGCESMQVFAKSPRQWQARPLAGEVAREFRERVEETGMGPVLVHTAYLINLGSADDALWAKSWRALSDELSRAELLGATFVVTHLGTEYRSAPERTAERISSAIDAAWESSNANDVRLLLENTAGAGTTFGDGPEELAAVLGGVRAAEGHVGVCLDTCHAHAAGWDLSRATTWTAMLDAFEAAGGTAVEAVHANDCLYGPGLHKDRHAWIGDGSIGYDGFARLFEDGRLRGVPVITEMPGDVPEKDLENIRRLKRLRDASGEPASSV